MCFNGQGRLRLTVHSEQRGPTGSEVSVLTVVEERGVLLSGVLLDVTSVAVCEPVS